MTHPKNLRIEDYAYELPDEKVAKYPLEQRDASKLLIYDKGVITEDTYQHIAAHIPADTLLVFNQTRVVHARLLFQKSTGGIIEAFCLEPHEQYADIQTAMQQKGKVWWKCMVGGVAKWKPGMELQLANQQPAFTVTANIVERNTGAFILEFTWGADLSFAEILHYAGKVPLPPYLRREAEPGDDTRYQTIYAKAEGSVAAPTAGLHFTEQVMDSLSRKNIDTAFVTLHVGAGTFKPVKADTMHEHEMHAEWIDVDSKTLDTLLAQLETGIVAVGTTSMRTIESLYWIGAKLFQQQPVDLSGIAVTQWQPYEQTTEVSAAEALKAIIGYMDERGMARLVTRTQIIIAPGYRFRIAKGLITNFHQPQSTLLLLVAALIGKEWRDVYDHALANNYRFLSYGDGCLLWSR